MFGISKSRTTAVAIAVIVMVTAIATEEIGETGARAGTKRKDFYIFRHGQTDGNKNGTVQGRSIDMPLNEDGAAQARELALVLRDVPLEAV